MVRGAGRSIITEVLHSRFNSQLGVLISLINQSFLSKSNATSFLPSFTLSSAPNLPEKVFQPSHSLVHSLTTATTTNSQRWLKIFRGKCGQKRWFLSSTENGLRGQMWIFHTAWLINYLSLRLRLKVTQSVSPHYALGVSQGWSIPPLDGEIKLINHNASRRQTTYYIRMQYSTPPLLISLFRLSGSADSGLLGQVFRLDWAPKIDSNQ